MSRALKDRETGENDNIVLRIYEVLAQRMISFAYRPGIRLNEGAIGRDLGVSRTPVREALNRLASDGFLEHTPGQGFSRKPLEVKEIFDLYELRQQIEVSAVRLAALRATPEALADLEAFLSRSVSADCSIDEYVRLDEVFHEGVVSLTGNIEMLKTLKNINARIRFVRWIDMQGRRDFTQSEHLAILQALRERDVEAGSQLMEQHVQRRMEQIVETVKQSFARIYMGEAA
jgi:DNA-binding GntR family transcriptional regulator